MQSSSSLRLIAVTLLALLPLGCKEESKSTPPPPPAAPAPAAPAMKDYTLQGVSFQYPADWKAEEGADKKSVSLVAPAADGGWIPSVHLSIAATNGAEDLPDIVERSVELLGARKQDFQLVHKEEVAHPNGFKYGRVDYTNTDDNSGANIPLRQASIHVILPAKKRLEIQAATAKEVWDKYQPTFDRVIGSVKIPKP